MRLLSLFTGIGAFEKALRSLKIPYELVGFSEIDKFAIKSYCAIHNVDEKLNLGDIKDIKTETLKEIDIMTWGFPCQDISIAGKMGGIEKDKTRSGLYFEGLRILKEVRPKVSIIENVKNLTCKRFKNEFAMILKNIEDEGYNNYWRVLNAKDYGIPQNRERVFVVSIRKDVDKYIFKFPDKQFLPIKLEDLLEKNVEEKYYLSDKALGRIIKKSNRIIKENVNPDISSCIIAGYYKAGGREPQYIKDKDVKRITGLYDTDKRKFQSGGIYDKKGISPTIVGGPGGNIQPFILVKENKKEKYTKAFEGDSLNVSYPNNINKRGRVGRKISSTLLASNNSIATLEKAENIGITMYNPYNQRDVKDIAPTQTTNSGNIHSKSAILISEDRNNYFRIRKLTPKECWRLMGFEDEDLEKAKAVPTSDTQLYKQAGNSIVVNVLIEIFRELLLKNATTIEIFN